MTEDLSKVGRRIGNISDMPEELRKQLQTGKTDELESQIISVIKKLDGIANLDEILVGLYRDFNVIQQRGFLTNKLYRMNKSGLINSVEKKKGVYRVAE